MEIYLLTQALFRLNFLGMNLLMTRFTGKVSKISDHKIEISWTFFDIPRCFIRVFSSDDTVVEDGHESLDRRSQTPSVKSERTSSESSGMVAAYWTPQESPGRREPENHKMVVHSIPVQLASPVNTLQRQPTSPGNSFATP